MPEAYNPVRDMAFHDAMPKVLREAMAGAMFPYNSENAYHLLLMGYTAQDVVQMLHQTDMKNAEAHRVKIGASRA